MIVLGAAFLRSGFSSPGAEWNKVFGDDFEYRIKQGLLFARHASHGFEARTPVPECIDGAFETDSGQTEEWNTLNIPILADLFQVKKKTGDLT